MYKRIFLAFFLVGFFSIYSYDFYGKHYIASYKNCDPKALQDIKRLISIFKDAVQSSGATLLKYEYELFEGNGMTAFAVLSESHASIHTYPEHNACFVDLFTCGSHCRHEEFEEILKHYLEPQDIESALHIRS